MGPSPHIYGGGQGTRGETGLGAWCWELQFLHQDVNSSFWPSLWLELPILDLAGDASGQAFCLCLFVLEGDTWTQQSARCQPCNPAPYVPKLGENRVNFFFFNFGSRLITFIYISSGKGHRCEIIPDIFRWSLWSKWLSVNFPIYNTGPWACSQNKTPALR